MGRRENATPRRTCAWSHAGWVEIANTGLLHHHRRPPRRVGCRLADPPTQDPRRVRGGRDRLRQGVAAGHRHRRVQRHRHRGGRDRRTRVRAPPRPGRVRHRGRRCVDPPRPRRIRTVAQGRADAGTAGPAAQTRADRPDRGRPGPAEAAAVWQRLGEVAATVCAHDPPQRPAASRGRLPRARARRGPPRLHLSARRLHRRPHATVAAQAAGADHRRRRDPARGAVRTRLSAWARPIDPDLAREIAQDSIWQPILTEVVDLAVAAGILTPDQARPAPHEPPAPERTSPTDHTTSTEPETEADTAATAQTDAAVEPESRPTAKVDAAAKVDATAEIGPAAEIGPTAQAHAAPEADTAEAPVPPAPG